MKKEDLMETPLSREDIFHGRIFDVHKDRVALPDGRESTREVVHHKTGGVCVVPLTEDGKVYVVRQCRYPYHDILTEIPAGKLDHPGENRLEAAQRELREETGFSADSPEMSKSRESLGETARIFSGVSPLRG